MTARASSQALPVQTALQIYVGNNAGQWPAHASYLIINGYLSSSDLLNASHISGSNVPVADTTLNDFDTLTTERQKAVVQAAAAALPKGVVAHRLGDYVFTYHNIPRADMTQPVWLFIRWSNDIPISTIHNQQIVVGLLNGTTKVYSPGQFASELVNQNRLRASLKLPALPHPKDVTHTQPAVGE